MDPHAYVGKHRAEGAVVTDTEPQISADLPRLEQSSSLEEYLPERWSGLKRAWHKVRSVTHALGDALAIEHNGYRLTPGENIRARLGRFAMLTHPELGLRDQYNPVVLKAYANRFSTKFSKADYVKLAAYELLTLPVARCVGVLAINGAAGALDTRRQHRGLPPKIAAKLHARSSTWLDKYEHNNLNPVDRSKNRRSAARKAWLEHPSPHDPFDITYL